MAFAVKFAVRKLAALALFVALAAGAGCKPLPPCKASDTSCWPCTNPGNTNPSCPPFPTDAKKPKETR